MLSASTRSKEGLQGRLAGWRDVPALTANILWSPLAELTFTTRQAVHTTNQTNYWDVYGCSCSALGAWHRAKDQQRSLRAHRESMGQINYLHDFTIGLIYSILLVLICFSLKHSSFWPSDDALPLLYDLMHAIAWQCIFAFSVCIQWSQCPCYINLLVWFPEAGLLSTVWPKWLG